MHATLGVGKAHLKQAGHQTACAYVMSGQDQSITYQFLYSQEGITEILSILYRRNVASHPSHALCQGRAAKLQPVEGEVYVIQAARDVVVDYRTYNPAYVLNLTASTYYYGSRTDNLLSVWVFLSHRQRILAGRNVDTQRTAEVAQSLDGSVQASILTLLRAAGPHPVGRQAHAVQGTRTSFLTHCERCPYQVRQRLGNTQYATCGRVGKSRLRSMSQGSGNALHSTVIQSHSTTVAQRQLQLTLTLLAGHAAAYTAVNLVGKPVLAAYSLKVEDILEMPVYPFAVSKFGICSHLILALHSPVHHHRLGRRSEHLVHSQVKGTYTVSL